MLRQRVRARSNSFGGVAGRVLVAAIALAFVWYGLMLVLLSLKVDPGTVNSISGYRTAFDYLSGLNAADFDPATRAILAGAGALAFIVFGYLALKALPRPYLARHDLTLDATVGQQLVVEARALERVAEIRALRIDSVTAASARAGSTRLELDVSLSDAEAIAGDLEAIRSRIRAEFECHGLPRRPVDVTLTSLETPKRKELL